MSNGNGKGTSIIDAIATATRQDLLDIEARIEDLRAAQEDLNRQIDALKMLRSVVEVRVNGRPTKAVKAKASPEPPAPAHDGPPYSVSPVPACSVDPPSLEGQPVATAMDETCRKVYDLLVENGSMPLPAIASCLGRKAAAIATIISNSDWFVRRDGEVHIAKA